jgi:hypothetical protein
MTLRKAGRTCEDTSVTLHRQREVGAHLGQECNDLESQGSEDVHDRIDDGGVVVTERRVREDDEEGVESDGGVVLVVRGTDVGRVGGISRVERLHQRIVRDSFDDLLTSSVTNTHARPINSQCDDTDPELRGLP